MNKTELLTKADELIAKANELKDLANKEEDIILVPDEIKITKPGFSHSMWITNWNQELYYSHRDKNWAVSSSFNEEEIIKCKLTPCEYEDLKTGDVFYKTDFNSNYFGSLFNYAIKLNNDSYQYWQWKDCVNDNSEWKHYWKVEPIN